jgi:anti-anti-sigma factor
MLGDSPTALSVTASEVEGVCRLRFVGEIDLVTAEQFRIALTTAAASGGPVEVDLTDVAFLDAAGITALIRARQAAPSGIRLVGARGPVRRILEVTGMPADG